MRTLSGLALDAPKCSTTEPPPLFSVERATDLYTGDCEAYRRSDAITIAAPNQRDGTILGSWSYVAEVPDGYAPPPGSPLTCEADDLNEVVRCGGTEGAWGYRLDFPLGGGGGVFAATLYE